MNANIDSSLVTSGAPEAESVGGPSSDVYVFPCSVVQRTCWVLEQLSPGTAVNNIAVRFRLTGKLHPDLLEQSLNEIARRHEILRTRFIVRDGEPMQLIEPDFPVALPVVDLLGDPDAAERAATEEATLAFDIANGPLWRTRLLCTGPQEFILLVTIHHIIADGWSIGIITDELGQIYEALTEGSPLSLPSLSIQYADYASWQNEWMSGSELVSQLDYWKQRLDGFQPLHIPTDFERPDVRSHRGAIRSIVLSRTVTDALKHLSDHQGCTLFVTMLAAFMVLMRHESGQDDIVVRTQTAGRTKMELEPLIGWFVNSIVLRANTPGDAPFLAIVKQMQQVVLEALANQDAPFERVIEVARPKFDSPRHPPFQVNFIFQRDFVKPWRKAGIVMTPEPSAAAGTFADLNFFLVERSDGWRASVDVSTDVFLVATGDFLLRSFQTILEKVAQSPQVRIGDIAVPKRSGAEQLQRTPSATAYVKPRTHLETDLALMWERVLDVKPVGVLTNFFDLGGHSLLAVQIISKIQAMFGHSINIADIFRDPTVAGMARLLEKNMGNRQSTYIVPVQPEGTRQPFFMIGGDHWFRPLAVHTGLDQPFFGVPLTESDQQNIEEVRGRVAAEIADMLLTTYPGQPYFLGGWCADGITAYEVARAIEARGGSVGLLVEFDAMSPNYFGGLRSVVISTGKAATSLSSILRASLQKGIFASGASLATQIGVVLTRAIDRIRYVVRPRHTRPETSFPIVVLRPPLMSSLEDAELGWRSICPEQLTVVEVPGDHLTIFKEPHVRFLAQSLRRQIDLQIDRLSETD